MYSSNFCQNCLTSHAAGRPLRRKGPENEPEAAGSSGPGCPSGIPPPRPPQTLSLNLSSDITSQMFSEVLWKFSSYFCCPVSSRQLWTHDRAPLYLVYVPLHTHPTRLHVRCVWGICRLRLTPRLNYWRRLRWRGDAFQRKPKTKSLVWRVQHKTQRLDNFRTFKHTCGGHSKVWGRNRRPEDWRQICSFKCKETRRAAERPGTLQEQTQPQASWEWITLASDFSGKLFKVSPSHPPPPQNEQIARCWNRFLLTPEHQMENHIGLMTWDWQWGIGPFRINQTNNRKNMEKRPLSYEANATVQI